MFETRIKYFLTCFFFIFSILTVWIIKTVRSEIAFFSKRKQVQKTFFSSYIFTSRLSFKIKQQVLQVCQSSPLCEEFLHLLGWTFRIGDRNSSHQAELLLLLEKTTIKPGWNCYSGQWTLLYLTLPQSLSRHHVPRLMSITYHLPVLLAEMMKGQIEKWKVLRCESDSTVVPCWSVPQKIVILNCLNPAYWFEGSSRLEAFNPTGW